MFDLVIRPFKSNGVLYERGTVITDPSLIRRYIMKVREGKILQVDLENEKSAYKFDILTQKHNLDKNDILIAAGLLDEPSNQVEPEINDEVNYDSLTPAQKSAYTKRMKKLAEQQNK